VGRKKVRQYGSEAGYDLCAANYDEKLAFLDSFEKDFMGRMIGNAKGLKALDAGCGTGRLVPALLAAGAEVSGIDVSKKMLVVAEKKYPWAEFKVGDIEKIPYEDSTFDLVVATFVIVHLKDLRRAFDEVHRVLKEGGRFIVTNINQRKPPRLQIGKEELVIDSYYHMPKHVWESLEEAGFEVCEEEYVYDRKIWINQIISAQK
jgi:ubiquinone/menaquinone biosynthesis C-methylase UbiE